MIQANITQVFLYTAVRYTKLRTSSSQWDTVFDFHFFLDKHSSKLSQVLHIIFMETCIMYHLLSHCYYFWKSLEIYIDCLTYKYHTPDCLVFCNLRGSLVGKIALDWYPD